MCHPPCLNPFAHIQADMVDLPCGCQDIHYRCGCVCREHAHLQCDGQPVAELEETR
jgi:hypothetical protein